MKIVLVIPTLKQGGSERVIAGLANYWSQLDHEIHLILLAKAEIFYEVPDNVIIYDLGFENLSTVQKIYSELKVFFKLRSILRRQSPDFVLSFMEKYNAFVLIASIGLGIRVFVSDRASPMFKFSRITEFLRNLMYKYACGIIAQTNLAKGILKENTRNKNIKVIPNPVRNIEFFKGVEREKIILNIGRLVPEKGQLFLLESFASLNINDWQLVILGEGYMERELQKKAKELGIINQLRMPGAVTNVDEWLAKSSIFVFTSLSEGFPNALTEACAAGLPSVSFDCDAGPRDIIEDRKNGFLVPVGNSKILCEKIRELINSNKLRQEMGANGIIMSNQFEFGKIANAYLKFCQQSVVIKNNDQKNSILSEKS